MGRGKEKGRGRENVPVHWQFFCLLFSSYLYTKKIAGYPVSSPTGYPVSAF